MARGRTEDGGVGLVSWRRRDARRYSRSSRGRGQAASTAPWIAGAVVVGVVVGLSVGLIVDLIRGGDGSGNDQGLSVVSPLPPSSAVSLSESAAASSASTATSRTSAVVHSSAAHSSTSKSSTKTTTKPSSSAPTVSAVYLFPTGLAFGKAVRPQSVALAGDGSAGMEKLVWTQWGQTSASGSGVAWASDCDPDCAHGTVHRSPVNVSLSKPITACGVLVFSTIRYEYPEGSPRRGEPDVYTQTYGPIATGDTFGIDCG